MWWWPINWNRISTSRPPHPWPKRFTYIRIHEAGLCLAVIHDLFSRQVIGWSMRSRIGSELVMMALLIAVWHRKPSGPATVHSDQGSHYWQAFLKAHCLVASMSRRGNCYYNAVAQSFLPLLQARTYLSQDKSRLGGGQADVFNCIKKLCNPKRRHSNANDVSPVEFKNQYSSRLQSN